MADFSSPLNEAAIERLVTNPEQLTRYLNAIKQWIARNPEHQSSRLQGVSVEMVYFNYDTQEEIGFGWNMGAENQFCLDHTKLRNPCITLQVDDGQISAETDGFLPEPGALADSDYQLPAEIAQSHLNFWLQRFEAFRQSLR